MSDDQRTVGGPATMLAVRLNSEGGPEALRVEQVVPPQAQDGEALVRVHAAAITRDELEWPVDRLPAIPSYELSGVVVGVGAGVAGVAVGDAVFGLTSFDRDGVAAEYAAVPADVLAPKPRTLDHVHCAAVPMAGLSAWQGLFDHGRLTPGERVLIHGAAGGVGHLAVQLARREGAYVIGTASPAGADNARSHGAQEVLDPASSPFDDVLEPVDLVFDTVGGELLARSASLLRPGGRLVSIAEEPPTGDHPSVYFVVEPNRRQLIELGRLVDEGALRPAIDSVFALAEARAAFDWSMSPGKRGKVVLHVVDE
jgi:NADPH:quinone reductase-like Zn-dependent oxidoreductase